MPGISRRRFLRDASLGAAAVGALAVVGPQALGAATASASPWRPRPSANARRAPTPSRARSLAACSS